MSTTQLFNGLASDYQAYRPRYAAAALAELEAFAAPLPEGTVLDVGAGTGILLRQLCETFGAGLRYVGIEPGRDMIAKARQATAAHLPVAFVEAPAESVPLESGSAALLATAQALHWFDRPRFYAEAARLLAPGGTCAVLYNQRDTADAFNAAYEDFTAPFNARSEDEATGSEKRGGLGIVLLRDGTFRPEIAARFGAALEFHHPWRRRMTDEEVVGQARSTVQMRNVVRALGETEAMQRLRDLIARHTKGAGEFEVPYVTSLIAAKRRV
ncbi:MAG: class I SAM-dependent methyltransferase [Alphaproteobacteria bacterium]|nr:class I SAM-dependent methyltransferase [Alphaproteobacteria bacterium]